MENIRLDVPVDPAQEAKPSDTSGSDDLSAEAGVQGKAEARSGARFGCFSAAPPVTCGWDLGVWESSLEDRAGILSTWMFAYLSPLLKLGAHKVLRRYWRSVETRCGGARLRNHPGHVDAIVGTVSGLKRGAQGRVRTQARPMHH
jgi:hypothetical protein